MLLFFSKKRRFSTEHASVLAFIILLIFNSLLNEISSYLTIPEAYTFYFIHAFAPPVICSLLVYNYWRHLYILIISAILIGLINYYFNFDWWIVMIYNVTIGLLLRKGHLLTKKRSVELSRALVYVAMAIDLFATMMILPLKYTSYNWHEAELIQYLQYLRLSIFMTTLIIIHVKLRRFIVA